MTRARFLHPLFDECRSYAGAKSSSGAPSLRPELHSAAGLLAFALEPLTPEGITAAAIPVIALIVALGTRRMRKHLDEAEGGH